ncbi:MAG: primosomal protein N' [Firmicutes bacterium]|nr:primosomal protein N' [Bacillota bacterium]MCM1400750.1 primosomal protein N' [Bacteroides sp.]MCM1476831.1 primosomal protein N' [Bacteroides sp.]
MALLLPHRKEQPVTLYAEVILPLPLASTFTYRVPEQLSALVKPGHRVLVQFGKKKFYTAIVTAITPRKPEGNYEVKEIISALDNTPILRHPQMKLWEWVADYYLCSPGDVMKAALPAALKVESETFLEINPDYEESTGASLSEREAMIYHTLVHNGKKMSVSDIERTTGFNNVSLTAGKMLDRGILMVSEKLMERYVARKITYVAVKADRNDSIRLRVMFNQVSRSEKQQKALLALLEMSQFMKQNVPLVEVPLTQLLERTGLTRPIISALREKGIVSIYNKEINRFAITESVTGELPQLSPAQNQALTQLHASWTDHDVTLLHGVTSSGKTELYIHLIDFMLRQNRQVLYLVPEIALTTQLTGRLQKVFGNSVIVYHSKFSDNERVDLYRRILRSNEPAVIVGPRSAVFLPFANLGLVIVDEEHESSYKQQDPAPRYNGRDTSMVLARMHGAKVLLGSATPAIDTYHKATSGRYGLVTLSERYGGVNLPEIELVDTTKAWKASLMKGALAQPTINRIRASIAQGQQSIVFLNRRGYAPVAQCKLCAYTPKCEHCDVSLTYHKRIDKLVCHYCGAIYPLPTVCPACHEPALEVHGYGTERMEDEIGPEIGPETKVLRMDLDTTRNKDGYQKIITDFSHGKAQVLVGTQMVTKGLDFGNVDTVAIVNADAMINQPDFRATERAFNMISQVAGRAGRRSRQGKVIIQTRQPSHPLFSFITAHNYPSFYDAELEERRRFFYPPFTRLIYVYIKHRDPQLLNDLAIAYTNRLHELFGNRVFGPEEPLVARVQTLYIRKIMLKIEVTASMKQVKQILRATFEEMHASRHPAIKSAVVYYDVDPM